MSEKQASTESLLVNVLRHELSKRTGDFPKIAKTADVKVSWLHACMKSSYADRDIGVRKVEATLRALGVGLEVSVNA